MPPKWRNFKKSFKMRYYLIAGEASGDLHGSNLIKGLVAEDPEAELRFWGGDMMLEASGSRGKLVQHYREGAVMGLAEVVAKGRKLLGNISRCKKDILQWNPDVVILIDYPGFNMKIARFCHHNGIRVFYYIAPKTWASREARNRKLKAWVDRLFIVFPFEIPYFESKGIPFTYKGNPLVDAIGSHNFEPVGREPYIAVLAGSRKAEIGRMMPVCIEAARALIAKPEYGKYRFIVAGAPGRSPEDYRIPDDLKDRITLTFGRTYDVLKGARAAVINSGTASLEAALIGTPQVVGWSTSAVTAFVARHFLHVLDHIKYISLGNLCLDKGVFRELIQEDFTAANVAAELDRLCNDKEYRSAMEDDYRRIRESLGGGGASREVAKAVIAELRK